MDILKHYGFVVGSHNQIVSVNEYILAATISGHEPAANVQSNQTTPTQINIIHEHPTTLTQAVAAHVNIAPTTVAATSANSDQNNRPIPDDDQCPTSDSVAITQSYELLAISPPPHSSQSMNCSHSTNHNNSDISDNSDNSDSSHLEVEHSCRCTCICCDNQCNSNDCICNRLSSLIGTTLGPEWRPSSPNLGLLFNCTGDFPTPTCSTSLEASSNTPAKSKTKSKPTKSPTPSTVAEPTASIVPHTATNPSNNTNSTENTANTSSHHISK